MEAFLDALPHAREEEFVNAPGLGMFKAKHIRRGLERNVLVIHSTGYGLAIAQPSTHGACSDCKGRKGSQPCAHCACAMCVWFRHADELSSPRVSAQQMHELARRLLDFRFAKPVVPATPALDLDI